MDEAIEGRDPGRRSAVRAAEPDGEAWDDPRHGVRYARADEHPGVDEGAAHGFPGCRSIRIACGEIADYEGRIEYWDADTEIAWTAREPTSVYHELPGQRLARLTERIAAVRGALIESYGSGDLLVRNARGERQRIMQADQILYLHPGTARPLGHAVEVGHDDLPDVVLEVDLTTDVRPRKMGLYREWGFPELWVEVPDNRSPSRPNRKPGLTIRVLGGAGYEEVPESRAFPTWTASEIHAALNERALCASTVDVLRRVGRLLGERGGTATDDDLLMRIERERSRREGIDRGVAQGRLEMLAETLAARGIAATQRLDALAEVVAGVPVRDLLGAAQACTDEADFLRRIGPNPGGS